MQAGRKTGRPPGKQDTPDASRAAAPSEAPAAAAVPSAAGAGAAGPQSAKGRKEMTAKTVPEKQLPIGTVEVLEVALDARSLTIRNSGQKEESLEGWKLSRRLDDGKRVVEFALPALLLRAGQTIKVPSILHSLSKFEYSSVFLYESSPQ